MAAAALLALVLTTSAEARGYGGSFHGGAIRPQVGAWGRPLGPVRPAYDWRGGPPGFAYRHSRFHHHWHGGYWGYGLGGLGLGLGLGGLFGVYDDYVYGPPVEGVPVEVQVDVPLETEAPSDLSAAIAACARRFKTYDPVTQTFIGKGYVRRRCP